MPMFSRKKKKAEAEETPRAHARPRRRVLSDVHPTHATKEPKEHPLTPETHKKFVEPPIVVRTPVVPASPAISSPTPMPSTSSSPLFQRPMSDVSSPQPIQQAQTQPTFSEPHVPSKPAEAMFLSPKPQESLTKEIKDSRRRIGPLLAIAGGILVVGGLVAYTFWRASLTITVTPKELRYDLGDKGVQVTFDAEVFNSSLAKRGEGESTEAKKFSEKARGTIVIFNSFNTSPQTLVASTRFQEPSGKIYRIEKGVTVPGMKDGKPGSVEAVIVADKAGSDYNIGLTDFKIPGFQGSPKYDKFYARSKTEITGGASGEGKIVGQKEATDLLAKLEGEMLVELKKNFESTVIPRGYVTFPEKIEYTVASRVTDPLVGSPADKFFGEVRGEARTLGVPQATYSDALAKIALKDQYRPGVYVLKPNSGLTVGQVTFDYDKKQITATVTGKAVFSGVVPVDELKKKALASENYEALKGIFGSYPGIAKAEATFKPSFLKRIPSNPDRLMIEVR